MYCPIFRQESISIDQYLNRNLNKNQQQFVSDQVNNDIKLDKIVYLTETNQNGKLQDTQISQKPKKLQTKKYNDSVAMFNYLSGLNDILNLGNNKEYPVISIPIMQLPILMIEINKYWTEQLNCIIRMPYRIFHQKFLNLYIDILSFVISYVNKRELDLHILLTKSLTNQDIKDWFQLDLSKLLTQIIEYQKINGDTLLNLPVGLTARIEVDRGQNLCLPDDQTIKCCIPIIENSILYQIKESKILKEVISYNSFLTGNTIYQLMYEGMRLLEDAKDADSTQKTSKNETLDTDSSNEYGELTEDDLYFYKQVLAEKANIVESEDDYSSEDQIEDPKNNS